MVESARELGATITTERRYYSSLPPDATHIAHAVRAYWGMENGMHYWTLYMTSGEEQGRA